MSNKQARATKKVILKGIVLIFDDGTKTALDITKVQIIDRETKKPIFKEK